MEGQRIDGALRLVPFTAGALLVVEPWFDDAETRRWLGDRRWPSMILRLAAGPPGEHRGHQVLDRRAWLVEEDDAPVGLVDVEVYEDQTAGLAFVIAPDRRGSGLGRRALHAIAAKLKSRAALGRDQTRTAVLKSTGELAELAESAARDGERLLVNAKQAVRRARAKAAALAACGERDAAAGRRRGRLVRAVNDLANLLSATRQIATQARQRLAGIVPDGATRRVSLHDGDARPIAKGRLGKPVEFGHKAQVTDNDDGIVLDHTVEQGNPADAPQLAPAVERVKKRTGCAPGTVTADRGYGEKRVEDDLHDLGVRTVVIPRKGKPGMARQAEEHRPAFRRTIKWRTGCEGRISTLKRGYGWNRSYIDSTEGTRIWTGHGVLTHNLVKIGALGA